ncbi:GIY-YIG nuclease family protein [Pseudanabaena sp. FACHB-1998]|uniref:GIY-YIG nuclease family protein n=1 Tax=Pseudanabaena sp. FACHB-1998 TaxID=2692858 RepID=UPI00168035F3|nr:GIY-YIG nuclease family protein [Pseudanabaena sp. FACHB-1998]MBD2177708.1 GIY-YIG nuclease family protein [Pseudanabaena sp. FACHB-1998]
MPEWIRVFWLPSKSIDNLKELPQESGVYYITALWVVLYVGKAKNLRNRWRTNHHRYQQFKLLQPFGRLHYRVVSMKQLDGYEKSEISKFTPKWNGTSRPSFWNLLGLFLAVWGRVIVYASLLMLAIAVVIYSALK